MTDIITRAEFWVKHDALNTSNAPREAYTALHREYYGAYVKAFNVKAPRHLIASCKEALAAGDENFNSPYTQLRDWDSYQGLTESHSSLMKALRDNGEGWSLSVNICLLKEAARQEIEGA